MSYRTATFYVAVCDECRTEHENDEFAAWSDKDGADAAAESDGWTATRGRHLCPDCAELVVEEPPAEVQP